MQNQTIHSIEISTGEEGRSTIVVIFNDGSAACSYPNLSYDDISVTHNFIVSPHAVSGQGHPVTVAACEERKAYGA